MPGNKITNTTSQPGKNTFWACEDKSISSDESSYEESSSSCPSSPISPKSPVTPDATSKMLSELSMFDPTYDLIRSERIIIENGMNAIQNVPDTPDHQKQGKLLNRTQNIIQGTLGNSYERLIDSTWAGNLLGNIKRKKRECRFGVDKSLKIYNFHHISHLDSHYGNISGFHFCPPGHKEESLVGKAWENPKMIHPSTGVWAAIVRRGSSSKYSTFFPRSIQSIDRLKNLIYSAELVHESDNRELVKVNQGNNHAPFYVEQCLRYEGIGVHTFYPVMTYEQWEPKRSFQITRALTISSKKVIVAAKAVIKQFNQENLRDTNPINPIRYENGDKELIIDIARHLNDPIEQGVLFSIPKHRLASILISDHNDLENSSHKYMQK